MEAKDWAALAMSGVAVLISLAALLTARAGFRLSQEQDRRTREREEPSVTLELPPCHGSGPWTVPYSIRNRHPETVEIIAIRLPVSLGDTAVTRPAPFRFARPENVTHVYAPAAKGEAGDYEILAIGRTLAPGEIVLGDFDIVPVPRRPLAQTTEFRAYIDVVVRDRSETVFRLPIARTVMTESTRA